MDQLFAWVSLTLSAYFGEGCLSGIFELDSRGLCHSWHVGPFHSGSKTHLCGCVLNSVSQGETRLPVVTGLGVCRLVAVGDGKAWWGRSAGSASFAGAIGMKTFSGPLVAHRGVLGVG